MELHPENRMRTYDENSNCNLFPGDFMKGGTHKTGKAYR
jgi:hypothetical protein